MTRFARYPQKTSCPRISDVASPCSGVSRPYIPKIGWVRQKSTSLKVVLENVISAVAGRTSAPKLVYLAPPVAVSTMRGVAREKFMICGFVPHTCTNPQNTLPIWKLPCRLSRTIRHWFEERVACQEIQRSELESIDIVASEFHTLPVHRCTVTLVYTPVESVWFRIPHVRRMKALENVKAKIGAALSTSVFVGTH